MIETKWIDVGGTWLPDIAAMVRERLENHGPLKENHDFASIGKLVTRQLTSTRGATGVMRLSESGKCIRARAYSLHHWEPNGHTNDAGSSITFAIGDLTEAFLVAATREALSGNEDISLYNSGSEQLEVYLDIPVFNSRTARVLGHPDGIINIKQLGGVSIRAIMEYKSMSDYGFKMFKNIGLTEDDQYYFQTQGYMKADEMMTGVPCDWTYVMAWGKSSTSNHAVIDPESGEWWKLFPLMGQWIPKNPTIQSKIVSDYHLLFNSTDVNEFSRPYGPAKSGKKKGELKFPCSYCSYYKHCFTGAYETAAESKWLQKTEKIKVIAPEGNE